MKKLIATMLAGGILMVSATPALAALNLNIDGKAVKYDGRVLNVSLNGTPITSDVPIIPIEGRTMVPARAVFEQYGAKVDWDGSKNQVIITYKNMDIRLQPQNKTATVNGKQVMLDVAPATVNDRTLVPVRFVAEQMNLNVNWIDSTGSVVVKDSQLGAVRVSNTSTQEIIDVDVDYFKNYQTLTYDSTKVIVDLYNVKAGKNLEKVSVNDTTLNEVRWSQFEDNTRNYSAARVVVDMKGAHGYKVEHVSDQLLRITVEKSSLPDRGGDVRTPTPSATPSPTPDTSYSKPRLDPAAFKVTGAAAHTSVTVLPGITYQKAGQRIYFTLPTDKLGPVDDNSQKDMRNYKEEFLDNGMRYRMTFNTSLLALTPGTGSINDSLFSTVAVSKDAAAGTTTVEIKAKVPMVFSPFSRLELGETAITCIPAFKPTDRVVVIDAGHGGRETGAVEPFKQVLAEKNVNLDIALRLKPLLEAKGVKVYMTREDDTFVGLYERTWIANRLKATLFLSIHNNSYTSEFNGTETLHFPQPAGATGFNGLRFARIIQDKLIAALGTKDRGLQPRDGLVVLKATDMDASLAEIAFMSNAMDLDRLMTDSFRQKAAQALCDSVIQGLSEKK